MHHARAFIVSPRRRAAVSKAPLLMLGSLVMLGALVALLLWNPAKPKPQTGDPAEPLRVFVAAGVLPAVEDAGHAFEMETGVGLRIDAASSGALVAMIEQSDKGDLYIPADDSFIEDARRKGLIAEVIPFGTMRLVVGVEKGNARGIASLADLYKEGVTYALPNEQTASGKVAKHALDAAAWKRLAEQKKVEQPTVNGVAEAVKAGGVTAGIMWDTTARQFDLDIVELPEFASTTSTISAGVLRSTKRPTDALRLARFLAAPDQGQAVLKKHRYASMPGDPWALEPKILLFAGGLNGAGVRQTVDDFRKREGVKILEEYQGCGTLVGMMKAGQHPDAYFACDASFTRQVSDLFHEFQNVTTARMVILVPKGNPKSIATLEDLGKEGVAVGVADEEKSALGALTKNLLKAQSQSLYEAVRKNVRVTAPTADFLVAQLVESGRLHAAVVYDANCTYVLDKATMIPIPLDAAIAVQPIGVSKETKYPQLMARLRDAITTAQSKERFEKAGFKWVWDSTK